MKIKYKLRFSLQLMSISIWLTGCTSVPYLHSNETEIATQAVKEAATNIKIDQNFADVKKQLASFATREDQAVADYLIASRNRQLASLIRNSVRGKNEKTAIDQLQGFINHRLKEIIGEKPDIDYFDDLQTLPVDFSLIRERRENSLKFYQYHFREFNEKKKNDDVRSIDCEAEAMPKSESGLSQESAADIAYVGLVNACNGMKRADIKEKEDRKIISPIDSSILSEVFKETDNAQKNIYKEQMEAAKILRLISEIERASTSNHSDSSEITKKITEAQNLLKSATGLAKLWGAKKLSQSLEEILAADLETTTNSDPKTTQKAAAILKLTDSFVDAKKVFRDEPQINRVNSVLIALIEQRQKRDMALLDISRQIDLLRVYEAKQVALIQELAQLSSIKLILKTQKNISLKGEGGGFAVIPPGTKEPGPSVSYMLAAYSASWNQGQIPYQILRFKEVQIERAYHVETAALTAKNRKDLLAPALDELAAYGKGGIHPETIATLITNLGLIAAFAAR